MTKQLQCLAMLISFALLSLLSLNGWAQTFTSGGFTYTLSGGEATITATSQTSGDIVFPETVAYGGGTYPVTAISFTTTFVNGAPTTITGNSIRRIAGVNPSVVSYPYDSRGTFVNSYASLTSISFPALETLENCQFLVRANAITKMSLPALKTITNTILLRTSSSVDSVYLPLLESMEGGYSLCDLSALKYLELPSLKTINSIYAIAYSEETSRPLETIKLPELTSISARNVMGGLMNLKYVTFPKLISVRGMHVFQGWVLKTAEFAEGCTLNTQGGFAFSQADSLTIKGVTNIIDPQFAQNGVLRTLKYLSLPDVVAIRSTSSFNKAEMGLRSQALETFDAPNLTTLENVNFFNTGYTPALTRVNTPKLANLTNSTLFTGAPIKWLSFSGALQVDNDSRIDLDTYPTVVTITDANEVHDIFSPLFYNVKGGRFIAPRGKVALYATKWNFVGNQKTMFYTPVSISKTTDGSLYATGSILPSEGSFTYNGTTYVNQYDIQNAMTASECLDPSVLGPNDIGFTPSLSTLTVTNYTNPIPNFTAYYASAYTDGTTPTERLGELTLTPLGTWVVGANIGFGSGSPAHAGISTTSKGFLFRGNSNTLTELYLPYNLVETTASPNYLEIGTGIAQTSREDGNYKFYWYPGDGTYPAGFYECRNTIIPEGRAYLSIPSSMLSSAKGFKLVFEEGLATNIASTTITSNEKNDNEPWYTLQGIRLPQKPTQAGVYLHGGQKIAIR